MGMGLTVAAITDRIQTEADAYHFLEELRWPTGSPTCPHCGHVGADSIRPLTARPAGPEPATWASVGCGAVADAVSSSPC